MIASSHLSPGRVSQCRRWRHLRHLNYTLKIVTTTTTSPHAPKSNNSCTKTDTTFYPSQLSNNKNNSSPRSLSYKKRKKKKHQNSVSTRRLSNIQQIILIPIPISKSVIAGPSQLNSTQNLCCTLKHNSKIKPSTIQTVVPIKM